MNNTWWLDIINTRITVHLSFADRIRVLVRGYFYLRVETRCENLPGRVESETRIDIPDLIKKSSVIDYGVVTNSKLSDFTKNP